jgi:hypothetical protein
MDSFRICDYHIFRRLVAVTPPLPLVEDDDDRELFDCGRESLNTWSGIGPDRQLWR